MRPIFLFRHMMATTVLVAPRTGLDVKGMPTYGAAVSYRAKVYYTKRLIMDASRSPTSQVLAPNRVMHLNSADQILPTAQVTLSTADVGSTENWAIHPLITGVERLYDGATAHSTVLYLILLFALNLGLNFVSLLLLRGIAS